MRSRMVPVVLVAVACVGAHPAGTQRMPWADWPNEVKLWAGGPAYLARLDMTRGSYTWGLRDGTTFTLTSDGPGKWKGKLKHVGRPARYCYGRVTGAGFSVVDDESGILRGVELLAVSSPPSTRPVKEPCLPCAAARAGAVVSAESSSPRSAGRGVVAGLVLCGLIGWARGAVAGWRDRRRARAAGPPTPLS